MFDDLEMTFNLIDGKGFQTTRCRSEHGSRFEWFITFHIQDGLIIRENGYEMWRPDISW